jgi:hypothetical protein
MIEINAQRTEAKYTLPNLNKSDNNDVKDSKQHM